MRYKERVNHDLNNQKIVFLDEEKIELQIAFILKKLLRKNIYQKVESRKIGKIISIMC